MKKTIGGSLQAYITHTHTSTLVHTIVADKFNKQFISLLNKERASTAGAAAATAAVAFAGSQIDHRIP